MRLQSLLLEGFVAPAIIYSAVELDCDRIVIGTRGRTGLGRRLLGSVAAAVQRDAPGQVVAVHLPNRAAWELPDFADEEAIISAQRIRPFGTNCYEAHGRQER